MSNLLHHRLVSTVESPLHRLPLLALAALATPLLLGCGQDGPLFGAGPTGAEIVPNQPAPPAGMVPVAVPALPPPAQPMVMAPAPPESPPAESPGSSGSPPAPPPEAPPVLPAPVPCTVFGAFGEPELITGLDVSAQTLGPVFSADGLTLFFSTLGDGTAEAPDENIFTAQRKQGGSQFTPAALVPNLDADGSDEGTPFLSFDGLSLYFFSTRPGPGAQGDRDIWLATPWMRPSLSRWCYPGSTVRRSSTSHASAGMS
jgi:hypothetical protein